MCRWNLWSRRKCSAALAGDGELSLQLFSLSNVGGPGTVTYASREDSDPAHRPQLLLVTTDPIVIGTPPQITNFVWSVGGTSFTLSGTGPAGASYRMLATTNMMPPTAAWPVVDTGVFTDGVFSFTDNEITNHAQRFYRVASP